MQMTIDTLITADFLLLQNAERDIIHKAAIGISGGKIVFLGKANKYKGCIASKQMRLGHAIVLPGLVNAHTHASMTLLRGLADDLPLLDWLTKNIFPVEQHLREELVYYGALLGCAEMARTGTTAFSDMYLLQDGVCEAAEYSGLKCLAGEVVFSFPSPAYPLPEQALEVVEGQIERWKNSDKVRICVTPHAVYTTTPNILKDCAKLARQHGLILHTHLAETTTETATCLQSFQKRPVEYLHSLGILDAKTSVAHGVDLNFEELELLSKLGVKLVHNPKSNMKLASGVAPVVAMLEAGICVALGTDGAASNNALNMFAEMNTCALLHKVSNADPTALNAQTVLDMATLGGAEALGWQGLGRLEVGGTADLIALDLNSPNLMPMYNPVSHLVYAASGHEVCLTMVDGKIIYENGQYKTIDFEVLSKEINKIKKWVLDKASR